METLVSHPHAMRLVVIGLLGLMTFSLGCNTLGRTSLSSGRGSYNEVINRTEDEQILQLIVRQRYDESAGMLAVASVTANLKIGASLGANVGIGSDSGYEGNLVPFSAGATIEESPTISYVPLRGEEFVAKLLEPISGAQVLLLGSVSTADSEALRMLVRRANGVLNPAYAPPGADGSTFDRFVAGFASLRDAGVLDIVSAPSGGHELLFHDQSPAQAAQMTEILRALGIEGAATGRELRLPLRYFVGAARGEGLDFDTPNTLEVIDAAGRGIDVPEEHLAEGIARRAALDERYRFLTVRSSSGRPSHASVAVEHRGYWFYIDARDARSKQGFLMLRRLIGLRLGGSGEQVGPVLTVPVAD
jgi:hypothetical protein